MPRQFGLSVPELHRMVTQRSTGFYDLVQGYERILSHAMEAEGVADRSKWSWDLGVMSVDKKASLSEHLKNLMGIQDVGLMESMRSPDSAFNVVQDSASFSHGYGSLAMGADTPDSVDEIFARLFYTTPNIQIRGTRDKSFVIQPRYKSHFLREQAENIHAMKTGDFFRNKKMFVLDTETAGFSMESGIWQIAGRTIEDVEGTPTVRGAIGERQAAGFAADAVIQNDNMKKGMTVRQIGGRPTNVPLTDLFSDIASTGEVHPSIVEAISNMGDEILESHYIMGQNLSFDMPRITHDIKKALEAGDFDRQTLAKMDRIVQHLEGNVKLVDTLVLSQHIFQETGENAIREASELLDLNKSGRFSISNIMLQTNFLDLLSEDLSKEFGGNGWEIINDLLTGQGAHNAMVDTFMTAHLGKYQAEHISGQGRRLVARTPNIPEEMASTLRTAAAEAAAWTPYTRDPITRMRPIEYMVEHMRAMDAPLGKLNKSEVFFNAGMLSKWSDSMLTDEGLLRSSDLLYSSAFNEDTGRGIMGRSIRRRALDEGLAIGRLSPMEALMTTRIAELSPGRFGDSKMKRLVGDVVGSATLDASVGIDFKGRAGRNVAMSPEILRWAEEAGVFAKGTVTGEFISARWSTVRSPTTQGLALVADLFSKGEAGLRELSDFKRMFHEAFDNMDELEFEKRFGINKSKALSNVDKLGENVLEHGVQLGFIKDDKTGRMGQILNFMESEGFGLDNEDAMQARTHAFLLDNDTRQIHTGLTHVQTRNTVTPQILDMQRRTKQVVKAAGELSKDPLRKAAIRIGKRKGVDRVKQVFDIASRPTTKRLGIGGLAAMAGYYLYGRKKEQDPYDQPMEFGGWETGPLDGRTQYERAPRFSSELQPLSTAGVVGELDYNKIRHDNMSPNKYEHLF